MMHLNIPF